MPHYQWPVGRPRVIGLTMVKNEQDIIEPMLRHNASLLDALIVLDNGSVDDTRIIAMALARELGNVIVTDSTKFGYTQSERMTRLLHAAQTSYFADFVVFLDADEFIGTTTRAAFDLELATIPRNGFGAMMWHNFVLVDGATVADPPRGITHRLAKEGKPIYKSMLRLDGAFHADLIVNQGSHLIRRLRRELPGVLLQTVPLWHFPIRGQAQLTAKAVVGWLACLAANPRASERAQSTHWQTMFRRVVDGSGFDEPEVHKLSLHYADGKYAGVPDPPDLPIVHDPAPINTIRRYSTGAFLDPLILVARSWEKTLRAHDPLFRPDEVPGAVIDIPPFKFLHEKHQFASVLDVACGIGFYLELFIRLGVRDTVGVGTLAPEALILRTAGYIIRDPVIPFRIERLYALILCLDIAATMSRENALAMIGNADRHAEAMIAFSIDDPTAGHLKEWLARWRMLGWVPNLMETLALRCLSSSASLRRGLMILQRFSASTVALNKSDIPDGTEELLAIAHRPFLMPPVVPGVHEEALQEHAEISWLGYADQIPSTAILPAVTLPASSLHRRVPQ